MISVDSSCLKAKQHFWLSIHYITSCLSFYVHVNSSSSTFFSTSKCFSAEVDLRWCVDHHIYIIPVSLCSYSVCICKMKTSSCEGQYFMVHALPLSLNKDKGESHHHHYWSQPLPAPPSLPPLRFSSHKALNSNASKASRRECVPLLKRVKILALTQEKKKKSLTPYRKIGLAVLEPQQISDAALWPGCNSLERHKLRHFRWINAVKMVFQKCK